MDINTIDLPNVIYACFVLHNFCEVNSDSVNEDMVQNAISYDRYFQPPVSSSIRIASSNEPEGKKVRRILTKYFDP